MKIDSETLAKVQELPAAEQEEILKLLEDIDEAEKKEAAQEALFLSPSTCGLLLLKAGITRSWQKPLRR